MLYNTLTCNHLSFWIFKGGFVNRVLDESAAKYYDHVAVGLDGDVSFYVEEASMVGGQVLELGCGTGRVLIPVAEAGVSVVGLDNSPSMLEALRMKSESITDEARMRIRLVEDDMRTFALDCKFDLIIIPYRSLLHLSAVEDQRKALLNIHNHLFGWWQVDIQYQ